MENGVEGSHYSFRHSAPIESDARKRAKNVAAMAALLSQPDFDYQSADTSMRSEDETEADRVRAIDYFDRLRTSVALQ